jgi:hypothetical protein
MVKRRAAGPRLAPQANPNKGGPEIDLRTSQDWDIDITYYKGDEVVNEKLTVENAIFNNGFHRFVMDGGAKMIDFAPGAVIRLEMTKRMVSGVTSVIR